MFSNLVGNGVWGKLLVFRQSVKNHEVRELAEFIGTLTVCIIPVKATIFFLINCGCVQTSLICDKDNFVEWWQAILEAVPLVWF